MVHINLENYNSKWMFNDSEMPVAKEDLLYIRPLDEDSSQEIWSQYISQHNRHPMMIEDDEWTSLKETWLRKSTWHEEWNSDKSEPPALLNTVNWEDNNIIYFLYMRESVIETIWSVFLRNWKCFLFDDEGQFIFNPINGEIFQFGPTGSLLYGKKMTCKGNMKRVNDHT